MTFSVRIFDLKFESKHCGRRWAIVMDQLPNGFALSRRVVRSADSACSDQRTARAAGLSRDSGAAVPSPAACFLRVNSDNLAIANAAS